MTVRRKIPAGRMVAIADDFADTYRLDKFQREKLRELMGSMPALLRAAAEPEAKQAIIDAVDRETARVLKAANMTHTSCPACGGSGSTATFPIQGCPSCGGAP